MYIITKLLSVASPATNRHNENIGTVVANIVNPLPNNAIILDKINIGKRPYLSAIIPKTNEPTTEPTKNID